MIIKNWKLFLEEFIGNNPISNYDTYISDMNKTLKDKMFFIDEIKFDVIVDFGCPDGHFLYNLSKIKKNVKLIGYDLDNEMLNKAEK